MHDLQRSHIHYERVISTLSMKMRGSMFRRNANG